MSSDSSVVFVIWGVKTKKINIYKWDGVTYKANLRTSSRTQRGQFRMASRYAPVTHGLRLAIQSSFDARASAVSIFGSFPSRGELGYMSSKALSLNQMCLVSPAGGTDIRNDL